MNLNLNRFVVGYVTGVVTAPVVYFIFRKPLTEHVVMPFVASTIMGEDMDEAVFNFMSARLDFQETIKKYGKQAHEMKAQGYSNEKIADILDLREKQVRLLLIAKKPE